MKKNPNSKKPINLTDLDGTLYDEAKEIAVLVGFEIEDVQRDKFEDSGLWDSRLVPENRYSFCYWLLNFIWATVEEWREKRWQDYPAKVVAWYEKASRLECEAEAANQR
jgi:hypothetical protein